MRHWNRGRKTVRNLLFSVLLAFLVYASQGFPPYTVRGMCRQVQHDYLLEEELEPLYVQRNWVHYAANRYMRYTMIAARSGGTYTLFRYQDGLLGSHRDWSELSPVFGEGAVCAARAGTIYAAGPFDGAASATATVHLEKNEDGVIQRTRDIVLRAERLAEEAFAFSYAEEEETQQLGYWEEFQRMEESPDEFPEEYLQFRKQQGFFSMEDMEDALGMASLAE